MAGDKAVTGTKLSQEVRAVYTAMTGRLPGVKLEEMAGQGQVKVEPSESIKREVTEPSWSVKRDEMTPVKAEPGFLKGEPVYKAQPCQVKKELGESSASPRRTPASILQLYQVQCPAVQTPRKKHKVDLHIWIYMYIICIYVYVYMYKYVYMYICVLKYIKI